MPNITIIGGDREFQQYFDELRLERAEKTVFANYESLVRESVATPQTSARGTVTADDMYGYLGSARTRVEHDLRQRAQDLSPAKWLWYLRHIPFRYWLGELRTTGMYDSALAEVLSAESATPGKSESSKSLRYRIDEATAEVVAEFIAGVRYLSQIHTNLRWAGKGAEFSISARSIGNALPSVDTRQAVELYDRRVETSPVDLLSSTGSIVSSEAPSGCLSEIIAVSRQPPKGDSDLLQFDVMELCLDELARLNASIVVAGTPWWPEELPLLVGFLRAVKGSVESTMSSLMGVSHIGWFEADTKFIDSAPKSMIEEAAAVAADVFPGTHFPTTFRALFDAISRIKGNVWPFRCGPAIRTEGRVVCMDLYAATMMLHQFAEFHTQGGIKGDLRGRDFERAVQAVIDLSSWAPPPDLRQKVGQTIRIGGKDVTDLDAIGLKGRRLLLVSCKSRIYSEAFDQGDPQAIGATASVVKDALKRWREIKSILEANPQCLKGFDLSQFEILSIVCLPHVPYLWIGPETEFVASGLRAIVSVSELRRWLDKQHAEK
jgi:hypothetical protein